jgi:cobalt/nickel transport system permease protein
MLMAGWGATVLVGWAALRRIEGSDLPKIAVMTSAFFVVSLIHIPLGPASVHLVLNGLVGVLLGAGAFPAILLGVTLQAILFQHGGVAVIGVNALLMGLPALAAHAIFRLHKRMPVPGGTTLFGFLAGAAATVLSGILLALLLASAGEAFVAVAKLGLAAHLPVMVLEGTVTAAAVSFLARVKPELL